MLQKSGCIPRLLSYLGVSGYYLVLTGGAFAQRTARYRHQASPGTDYLLQA